MRNKILVISLVLAVGVLGFAAGRFMSSANADARDEAVDRDTLEDLYDSIFHRKLDAAGARFHTGRRLHAVLTDLRNSDEHLYYRALYKAVKAYEEAQRAPGELSEEDTQRYLDLIDSALSTLLRWVESLPDQDLSNATTGATEARRTILEAYNRLNATARVRAEYGLFNALERLGAPDSLPLPETNAADESDTEGDDVSDSSEENATDAAGTEG